MSGQESASEAIENLTHSAALEVTMFVHAVYFWLKQDLGHNEKQEFLRRLNALATIESVHSCYIGEPADTRREVIDHSYSYALVVVFTGRQAHDTYQQHPIHDQFREHCASFWDRVQIYDSTGREGVLR